MKSKLLFISTVILILILNYSKALSSEQFNFDVTEIEILNDGNLIKGLKRGTITINNEIIINSDKFKFDKVSNILFTEGNVVIEDTVKKQFILGDEITYYKNLNKFIAKNNVKIKDTIKKQIITANEATYFRDIEKFNLKKNVTIKDNIKNQTIISEDITYLKKIGEINSKGFTEAYIKKEYEIKSSDISYLINENKISSNKKTSIKHKKSNLYKLSKFSFLIEKEILNGEDVLIISNFGSPKSDKIYLSSGIFDFKKQNFIGKNPEVKVHKSVFDDPKNDPRIKGVSSTGNKDRLVIKKGIFTSCSQDSECPPWSISSQEITHDRQKKEIHYKNAILRVYDFPILYFPKFFHPDPTVVRRSGFLKPKFNNSQILGSSLSTPYFKEISDNIDFTLMPTIFDKNIQMVQNEYRQINEYSKLIAHFGYVNNYNSSSQDKKNSIFHFFSDFELDLNLDNFISSNFKASIERANNDTYLKIFESNLQDSIVIPGSKNTLKNELKVSLDHEKFDFESGIKSYEDLQKKSTDRYEYIFPYYNFSKILSEDIFGGSLNFSSDGKNQLINTNDLKSNINNNLNYNSDKFISNNGWINNIMIDFKNLNSIGKNNSQYKSSPQVELVSIYDFNTSIPLVKTTKNSTNFLTPKLSVKFNPSDMKNYSDLNTQINTDNIFSNNRIGASDTFETGRSLTLGLNYKKENLDNINKFFELKLATVLRDKEEDHLPSKSTLNRKSSNLFGSVVSNKLFENIDLKYNFALDNNYKNFEYNNLSANINFHNFETIIKFIEENGEMGDSNILENEIYYNFDENNSLSFQTRRNRKLNLTEYYDLVYEYKNDCLTAGIKFKKTYYEDRDLLPNEDLFFTITLIPLTTHEQEADKLLDGTLGF